MKEILTAVIIKDEATGGYTGFYEEYPGAIAEGETEEDVLEELKIAKQVLEDFIREQS